MKSKISFVILFVFTLVSFVSASSPTDIGLRIGGEFRIDGEPSSTRPELNESGFLSIKLALKNFNSEIVKFKIKEFVTWDLVKMNPYGKSEKPIEERIENSKTNQCTIEFPKEILTLNPNEEKSIDITIKCDKVTCVKHPTFNKCEFTSIPLFEVYSSSNELVSIPINNAYLNYNYYIITSLQGESSSNLGSQCNDNNDCLNGFCLYCPADTRMDIQTDEDPYAISNAQYMKEQYGDKFQGKTEPTIVTKTGVDIGYCGFKGYTKCWGSWRNSDYEVRFFSDDAELFKLNNLLTKDLLDLWRKEVLTMISEKYFNEHFNVSFIQGELWGENRDEYIIRINYDFNFDWINEEAGQRNTWTLFKVAKKVDGKWVKLSEEDMIKSYYEELERWHKLGKIRPEEYELNSTLTKEETEKKLHECHKKMKIEEIAMDSHNNTIELYAQGYVNSNTENCTKSHYNSYTRVVGSVNLMTGELICKEQASACAVFKEGNVDSNKQVLDSSEIWGEKKSQNLFSIIMNWFKKLFS